MDRDELSKIGGFLDEANQILKNFTSVESTSNSLNFIIDVCFRAYDILNSIDLISRNKENLREVEHPIGLLLRSGLSDFIYFQYYSNKCIANNVLDTEKFEYEISEFIAGHFNRIDQSLESLEDYKKQLGIEELKNKIKYKEISIQRQGMSIAKEKKLNYLEVAVECWEWYSKYEHYGFFTNRMLLKFEDNRLRLNTSINLLFASFYFCLIAIQDIDSTLFDLSEADAIQRLVLENTNANSR